MQRIIRSGSPQSIMMRTKFPRFLDFIKASASLHQFQREWEDENTIIASKKDYEIACKIMKHVSSNKYLVPLTKNQRRIMEYLEEKGKIEPEYKETATKIRQQLKNFISLPAICKNLTQLSSYGLLNAEILENEHGREIEYYSIHHNILNGLHTISFPTFEEILDKNE